MSRTPLACLFAAAVVAPAAAAPAPVALARGGKPLVPVVVAADASPRVKAAAADLASYLGKMAGAPFEVTAGDGTAGLAVGLPASFPALPFRDEWKNPTPTERELYRLRTHPRGAYLIGATEQAVEHAVWDFLHRLGYRHFFPADKWEVVPKLPDLSAALEVDGAPSYHSRRIWYGYGPWDYAAEPYKRWCARNRATAGLALNTGHAYGGIISALKKDFDAHPEWYALVNGKRNVAPQAKLCLSNADLRARVAAHAADQFKKNPALDSVSMDPSDGGGWCECAACQTMGSVSDRAITLANDVAAAANAQKPGAVVGLYAYAYHSPPPAVKVHPQVVVSVATAFIKGGNTLNDLLAGWQRQGATLGVREYYSVNTWDRDQPGKARGGNPAYLARTIPEFHAKGARFLSAEASDNWGPNGLGYYLAARMLWDVSEAKRVDELTDDFLTRAFGPAKEPMRAFYRQLDASTPHLVADDQLGRMFRALAAARTLAADDPAVLGRLDDLALYAHYASLYHRYAGAAAKGRQAAFEALIRHAYRMRTTMLVHAKGLYRDLDNRDKGVTVPAEAKWNVPEGKNPWKSSAPFTAAEVAAFVSDGVERHQLVELTFQPKAFETDLVPAAAALGLAEPPAGSFGAGRGVQTFFTHLAGPGTVELAVTGGQIAHYRDRGNVKVTAWKIGGASQTGEAETLAAEDRSTPPDGTAYVVKLPLKEAGLYKVTVSDGGDKTTVAMKSPLPWSVPASAEVAMSPLQGRWTMLFYVPKGTAVVGLFGGGTGEVLDGSGKRVLSLEGQKPNFHGVPVPAGQDGTLWRIKGAAGRVQLLTVPPYLAATAGQLLLPADVVAKDRK